MSALMRGAGIDYTTAYDLLRRPLRIQRVDLGTLERACQFRGCEPGELLVYDPDVLPRERPQPAQDPLQPVGRGLLLELLALRPGKWRI